MDIRETCISKEAGLDHWDIWTSDMVEAKRLERKGWTVEWGKTCGPYVYARIPKAAVSIRSKPVVERFKERSESMRGQQAFATPNVPAN